MALDTKLTQNIQLRATGQQLLGPLQAFGREIQKVIGQLDQLSKSMTAGSHKNEDGLRRQVQLLQRLVGEASTLQNILTASGNQKRDTMLSVLEDDRMGRRVASASRMRRELTQTTTVADALEKRLSMLNHRFNELGRAGRTPTSRDLSKQFNTEKAIQDVRRLERELERLDNRALGPGRRGGTAELQKMRADIDAAQLALLQRVHNPRRSNWQLEIGQINQLVEKYKQLIKVESDELRIAQSRAAAARATLTSRFAQTDEMMRASLERGASQFAFTTAQARGAAQGDPAMRQLSAGIDSNIAKMQRLRDLMGKALNTNVSRASIDRLNRAYDTLGATISRDIALMREFNRLPEQRGARAREMIRETLFGDGGMGFAARIGGAMVIGSGIFAAINAIQGSLRFVVDFEQSLARLGAIGGATSHQLEGLANSVFAVGRNSNYSLTEITQAATSIAQAGFAASETGQVMRDALTLAVGSGSTPGESVDLLTAALGAFQLQAEESTRTVDIMMQGLNRSRLTIEQLRAAIQYAGATARENNISFSELTTVASSLANAGIRSGSTIGTGLRQLLVDLKTPTADFRKELTDLGLTVADVDVRTLGFAEVVRRLTEAGFSATQAYESFEVRAAASFLAFRNQLSNYDDLAAAIAESGAAAEAAEKVMDTFASQWQRLLNVLGEFVSTAGDPILDIFTDLVGILADCVEGLNDTLEAVDKLTDSMGMFGDVLDDSVMPALIGFTIGRRFGGAHGGLIGALIGGFIGLVSSVSDTRDRLEEMTTAANEASEKLSSQQRTVNAVEEAIQGLNTRQEQLKENSSAMQTEVTNLTERFSGLSAELVNTAQGYDDVVAAMHRLRGAELRQLQLDAEQAVVEKTNEREAALDVANQRRDARYARRGSQVGIQKVHSSKWNGQRVQQLLDTPTTIQNARNLSQRIQAEFTAIEAHPDFESDPILQRYSQVLRERRAAIQQVAAATSEIMMQERIGGLAEEQARPDGQNRYAYQQYLEQGVSSANSANQRSPGSGEARLTRIDREAQEFIATMERERADMLRGGLTERSPEVMHLSGYIDQAKGIRGQVARARRVAAEESTAGGVGEQLVQLGPPVRGGRRTSGFGMRTHPITKKRVMHRGVDYAAPPGTPIIAAADGFVKQVGYTNVNGNFIVLDHGGVETWYLHMLEPSPLQVGQEVSRGDQIGQVGSTGRSTGNHVHFQVKVGDRVVDPESNGGRFTVNPSAAAGSAANAEIRAAQQAERDLRQLQSRRAGRRVSAAEARIQRIITEARAGIRDIPTLNQELATAFEEFAQATLDKFNADSPLTDVDGQMLTDAQRLLREEDRLSLSEETREKIRRFRAEFFRHTSDAMEDMIDAQLDAADRAFSNREYEAGAGIRQLENRQAVYNNPLNQPVRSPIYEHMFERQRRQAERERRQGMFTALSERAGAQGQAVMDIDAQLSTLREMGVDTTSEHYQSRLEQRAEIYQKLIDTMRELKGVQDEINASTQKFIELPLGEQLKLGIEAWAENSGVMDTWSQTISKNIIPALETVTNALTNMVSGLMTGTMSIKSALASMIQAIGQFVIQIIAKALALQAIKWFLRMIGLELAMDDSGLGPVIRSRSSFQGGLVTTEPEGRFQGGITGLQGGGRVNRGVSNRDSALYNLAEGEYVVRNQSVRDLGVDFMDDINRNGKKALDKLGGAPIIVGGGQRQEVNVWLVQEEQLPPLGPNDVKHIIGDDIIQGGTMKKLIKQVAQGA